MKQVHAIELMHATPVDGRGRRTNELLLRLDERDWYLRAAAAKFCAGMSNHQAADFLRMKLSQYRGGRWRRDAIETTCPVRLKGRIEAHCWLILKSRDRLIGDRMMRAVLGRDIRS